MMKHKRLDELEMGESADNTYVSMQDGEVMTQPKTPVSSANNNAEKRDENKVYSNGAPYYSGDSAFGPSYVRLWQCGVALLFIIIIVLAVLLGVLQHKKFENIDQLLQNGQMQGGGGAGSGVKYVGDAIKYKSCMDIYKSGKKQDGYYIISSKSHFNLPTEVYCDMTTDGGGWTLVASVHEDNIRRKCDSHDMWSRYADKDEAKYSESGNWVNEHTFGSATTSTSLDYKNRAYGDFNASNIMMWHVPDGGHLSDSKKSSKLRYYTNNNFLQKYGGNLKNLYKKYQPLTIGDDYLKEQVNTMIDKLAAKGSEMAAVVTDFHKYPYDSTTYDYRINSGGGLFYNGGNQVSPRANRCYGYLDYGENKTCDEGSAVFTTRKSMPFMGLAMFMNEFGSDNQFGFRDIVKDCYREVRHNRPRDSSDDETEYSGNITMGNYFLQYYSYNVYSTISKYPTVSELHYVITNTEDWNSTKPEKFGKTYSYHSSSLNYYNGEVTSVDGRNMVSGYMMLTTKNGKTSVPDNEVRAVCNIILKVISDFKQFVEFEQSLSVPVKFDQGSPDDITKMAPPHFENLFEPGFIQFSPRNAYGFPNAICPGLRVRTMHPEFLCIGGIASDDEDSSGTCGDFAGWDGIGSDSSRTNPKIPKGWAHSQNDIHSSILIFYR